MECGLGERSIVSCLFVVVVSCTNAVWSTPTVMTGQKQQGVPDPPAVTESPLHRSDPRFHHFATFLFSVLDFALILLLCFMADDLHLFGRSYNLFHQSKVYQVKHTNIDDKQWVFRQKNSVKQRAAEEQRKTIPQIYHEEASSASADLETAEENLSISSEHSVWSMDGTFKIVAEWYHQIFTIHVFIADGSVGGGPSASNNRPVRCTAEYISGGQHARLLFPFLPSSSAECDGSWDAYQLYP
ncbi:putative DNA-directed RNA polymerase subunit L [Trichinella spiralis]|uniref:putative DNA-directed RNA polymerase subunit L n=1 Tax=Trichinella spiralis TaxID=6334 RepID=UPI0001EFD59C|nr:putative DNA-directed RNA polymerase subunit L [Trichinella spiralis]